MIATRPTPLDGPINVELGTLAILLRHNDVVDVLSPGRYSRTRLAMMGILPNGLATIAVRTSVFPYDTTVDAIRLRDAATVDVAVTVHAKLRIDLDQRSFFRRVLQEFGTHFASVIPGLLDQLVREALQESGAERDTALAHVSTVRRQFGNALAPHELFEIVDVPSLRIVGDDPFRAQQEAEIRLAEIERGRALRGVQLASETDQLRLEHCTRLAQVLGVDPLYLWDPQGYQASRDSQISALVSLLGQYGENVAVLAETLGMDSAVLGSILSGAGLHPQPGVLGTRSSHGHGSDRGGADGIVATYQIDDSLGLLPERVRANLVGGVFRQMSTPDGELVSLAILVCDDNFALASCRAEIDKFTENESLIAALVNAKEHPQHVFRSAASQILGISYEALNVQFELGQLLWEVPQPMLEAGDLGSFVAESICDLFVSPVAVALA